MMIVIGIAFTLSFVAMVAAWIVVFAMRHDAKPKPPTAFKRGFKYGAMYWCWRRIRRW